MAPVTSHNSLREREGERRLMGEGWGRQRDIAGRGRGGGSNNRIEEREGGEIERAEKEK